MDTGSIKKTLLYQNYRTEISYLIGSIFCILAFLIYVFVVKNYVGTDVFIIISLMILLFLIVLIHQSVNLISMKQLFHILNKSTIVLDEINALSDYGAILLYEASICKKTDNGCIEFCRNTLRDREYIASNQNDNNDGIYLLNNTDIGYSHFRLLRWQNALLINKAGPFIKAHVIRVDRIEAITVLRRKSLYNPLLSDIAIEHINRDGKKVATKIRASEDTLKQLNSL